MRQATVYLLILALAGCASHSQADKAQQDTARKTMNDCLVREEIAVAPKSVDLDTAARAVLTRCDFLGFIEQPLIAEHPGMRDVIDEEGQKLYAKMLDQVRGEIAIIRTR